MPAQLFPGQKPKRSNAAELSFEFQCRALKLPQLEFHYRFPNLAGTLTPKTRKLALWEFDFAFLEFDVLVEIDGGIWIGGAHSHPVDVTRNMTKQNDATLLGFSILRFTPREVKTGHAVAFTQKLLHKKGWSGIATAPRTDAR